MVLQKKILSVACPTVCGHFTRLIHRSSLLEIDINIYCNNKIFTNASAVKIIKNDLLQTKFHGVV